MGRNRNYFPENYQPELNLKQTEKAIKLIKDFFQQSLAAELKLRRVTAPLVVLQGTGINDDLNATEKPVSFSIGQMENAIGEVPQSLAKWKRMILADYEIEPGYGIYTDMNALRPDDSIDNLHSIYVDQWDWELSMRDGQRNLEFLKNVVKRIYNIMRNTEFVVFEHYPAFNPTLPEEITFIHAEELAQQYPNLTIKEREDAAAEKYGAIFIIGIGDTMANGEAHDGRAPDYDDWTTENSDGYKGLNGDIVLWNPLLKCAFEVSSMGIRVDKDALTRQLEIRNLEERKNLLWHKRLLNGEYPQSIGGGIGQSRLCMFLLRKAHVGEIQSSIWPAEVRDEMKKHNIVLL